jgi:UDP-2,4-diacetamido-2,4,6-trideoxy-beta-L-altropyranose hydrolase
MSDRLLRVEMQIVFRTDASLQIGTGHVMRCLTLAHALQERGAQCSFICREHPGNLIDQIRQQGFLVRALPCDQDWTTEVKSPSHASWLGADWLADARESQVGAGETAIDWLIVDHYALDSRWEHAMRAYCRHIMVIDDLADRPHYCDLLLDPNLDRNRGDYSGLLNGKAKTLIGPQYALLRPEFAALRPQSLARRQNNRQLGRLLVIMGGVDNHNTTGQVLDTLRGCKLPTDLRVSVVLGQHAPWLVQVQAQTAQLPWHTDVLVGVNNVAQLMVESDLAIGAAGGTAWERCCLGLPSLVLVLAKNQSAGTRALHAAGAAIEMQSQQQISDFMRALQTAEFANEVLAKLSNAAAAITDGQGCARAVKHIAEAIYV